MSGQGILVEVRNRAYLVRSYGQDMAESLEHEIAKRAREICGGRASVTALGMGRFAVRWQAVRDISTSCDELDADGFVLELCNWASGTSGLISFAVLSTQLMSVDNVTIARTTDEMHEQSCELSSLQASLLSDMDTVEMIASAIESDRFVLEFQSVCHIERPDRVLYRECLLRLPSEQLNEVVLPGAFIPTLERLGLMRMLDRYVVRRVVALLKTRPDLCLGVNISAQSAVDDAWWAGMFNDLSAEPGLAQRLVIEITETAPLRAGCGRAFANRLRQLGCRVAIDDFGVAYGVETGIAIRSPDIIKIDGSFLYGIGAGQFNVHPLAGMVSLASTLAGEVVVEGVENEAALRLARKAGAHWVQGYYVGAPGILPLA